MGNISPNKNKSLYEKDFKVVKSVSEAKLGAVEILQNKKNATILMRKKVNSAAYNPNEKEVEQLILKSKRYPKEFQQATDVFIKENSAGMCSPTVFLGTFYLEHSGFTVKNALE